MRYGVLVRGIFDVSAGFKPNQDWVRERSLPCFLNKFIQAEFCRLKNKKKNRVKMYKESKSVKQ